MRTYREEAYCVVSNVKIFPFCPFFFETIKLQSIKTGEKTTSVYWREVGLIRNKVSSVHWPLVSFSVWLLQWPQMRCINRLYSERVIPFKILSEWNLAVWRWNVIMKIETWEYFKGTWGALVSLGVVCRLFCNPIAARFINQNGFIEKEANNKI